MPDTPYPGVPVIVASELRRIEGQCDGRHMRQNKAHLSLEKSVKGNTHARIELMGTSGKNGIVGRHDERIDKLEDEQKKQRAFLVRLALAVATSAAAGGAGMHWVLH